MYTREIVCLIRFFQPRGSNRVPIYLLKEFYDFILFNCRRYHFRYNYANNYYIIGYCDYSATN